jgi:hypothetical protein
MTVEQRIRIDVQSSGSSIISGIITTFSSMYWPKFKFEAFDCEAWDCHEKTHHENAYSHHKYPPLDFIKSQLNPHTNLWCHGCQHCFALGTSPSRISTSSHYPYRCFFGFTRSSQITSRAVSAGRPRPLHQYSSTTRHAIYKHLYIWKLLSNYCTVNDTASNLPPLIQLHSLGYGNDFSWREMCYVNVFLW